MPRKLIHPPEVQLLPIHVWLRTRPISTVAQAIASVFCLAQPDEVEQHLQIMLDARLNVLLAVARNQIVGLAGYESGADPRCPIPDVWGHIAFIGTIPAAHDRAAVELFRATARKLIELAKRHRGQPGSLITISVRSGDQRLRRILIAQGARKAWTLAWGDAMMPFPGFRSLGYLYQPHEP